MRRVAWLVLEKWRSVSLTSLKNEGNSWVRNGKKKFKADGRNESDERNNRGDQSKRGNKF
jgi:hypothetical protein